MMKTLESDYLSGEGRGFIRDQALLAIIVLSSEDDWSSNSLSSVKTKLDEVKRPFSSGTKAWTLNLIGVPNLQSSCSTSTESGYREPGLRWIDLVNYTNGVIEPICNTDLGQAVANVRKRIVNILTEFVLDRKPVVETIVVTKNGVPVPQSTENGWEYIEEGRILRLHGTAIPMDGDQIFLDYKPAEGT
jgi:hypothetical protein